MEEIDCYILPKVQGFVKMVQSVMVNSQLCITNCKLSKLYKLLNISEIAKIPVKFKVNILRGKISGK